MGLTGVWPFAPLERVTEELVLENGGKIVIQGKEDRGFGSDGFIFEAGYLPPRNSTHEHIGSWISHRSTPRVFLVNDLVVVLNPDRKRLHIRTRAGTWKWFLMKFPDSASSFPVSHYVALTSLSETALELVRNEQSEANSRYSPTAYIDSFEPLKNELVVIFYSGPDRISNLILSLAVDGTYLELKRIERQESYMKAINR